MRDSWQKAHSLLCRGQNQAVQAGKAASTHQSPILWGQVPPGWGKWHRQGKSLGCSAGTCTTLLSLEGSAALQMTTASFRMLKAQLRKTCCLGCPQLADKFSEECWTKWSLQILSNQCFYDATTLLKIISRWDVETSIFLLKQHFAKFSSIRLSREVSSWLLIWRLSSCSSVLNIKGYKETAFKDLDASERFFLKDNREWR